MKIVQRNTYLDVCGTSRGSQIFLSYVVLKPVWAKAFPKLIGQCWNRCVSISCLVVKQ